MRFSMPNGHVESYAFYMSAIIHTTPWVVQHLYNTVQHHNTYNAMGSVQTQGSPPQHQYLHICTSSTLLGHLYIDWYLHPKAETHHGWSSLTDPTLGQRPELTSWLRLLAPGLVKASGPVQAANITPAGDYDPIELVLTAGYLEEVLVSVPW